jgi:PAS domain S-box-containing protein
MSEAILATRSSLPIDSLARRIVHFQRNLTLMLLANVIVLLCAVIIERQWSPTITIGIGFILLMIAAKQLLTPERFPFIATFVHGGMWLLLTLALLTFGGIRFNIYGAYILLVLSAGITMGWWGWRIFTMLALLGWAAVFAVDLIASNRIDKLPLWELWLAGGIQIGLVAAILSQVLEELQVRLHQSGLAERRANRQRDQAEQLAYITRALTASINTPTVLDEILRQIIQRVPIKATSIALVEGEETRLRHWVGYEDFPPDYLNLLQAVLGLSVIDRTALETGQPVIIPDVRIDSRWQVVPGTEWIHGYACWPLTFNGQTIGIIRMDADQVGAFPPNTHELLAPIMDVASIALGHARLYEQAQHEIAERRRAQQELEAAKQELEALNRELEDHVAERTRRLIDILEDLQKSEQRYRALTETVTDLISQHTPDGVYTYASPASQQLLGYRPEELVGRSAYDFFHPDDLNAIIQSHTAISRNSGSATVTYRIRRADGTYVWFETTSRSIRNPRGEIEYIICASRDVTYRKLVEAAIERSEANLRAVLDSTNQAFILIDAHFIVRMVNRAASEYVKRYTDQDIYAGANILDLMPTPAMREAFITHYERALAGEVIDLETPILFRGEEHYFELHYTPVLTEQGKPLGVCFVANNVTKRYQIQRELKAARDQLQAVVENAPIIVYVKDMQERYTMANRHYLSVLGLPDAAALVGRTDSDIYPASIAESHAQHTASIMANGVPLEVEETLPAADGSSRTYYAMKFPLHNGQGEMIALCGMMVDITNIKRAEEELRHALQRERELGELKTRFVAMTSHEFRTPLATIQANMDILSGYYDRLTPEKRAKHTQVIAGQIAHMTAMLDDVLTFNRFEEGTTKLLLEPIALVALADEIIDQFRQIVRDHEFVVQHETRPLPIEADKTLIRQAITNVLSNACKYSPAGSTVTLRTTEESSHALITISDQGIGIPEQDLPYLFEAFHRADNVGNIQGTGLGLVITKRAIEAHGGTIEVVSRVGVGTTILIRLPRHPSRSVEAPYRGA